MGWGVRFVGFVLKVLAIWRRSGGRGWMGGGMLRECTSLSSFLSFFLPFFLVCVEAMLIGAFA